MAYWIWYPGDYEIYHGMRQNTEREERGYFWPAYWKMADPEHHVRFRAEYSLKQETSFRVTGKGWGYVSVKYEIDPPPFLPPDIPRPFYQEKKYAFSDEIMCPAENVIIEIVVVNTNGLPCIFVEGERISSGKDWKADDFASEAVPVGYYESYQRAEQNPMLFEYSTRSYSPISGEKVGTGILYDFGKELTAETILRFQNNPIPLTICYGESRAEALDVEQCYLKHKLIPEQKNELFGSFDSSQTYRTRLRAFRYIYIPEGEAAEQIQIEAEHKFVDFPKRSSFTCSDARMNQIWNVSEETFRLASGIFFIDGVKRDRWIWSGDAYQSYFINQYLFYDADICKRTILALRGKDPITQHLNTILDYSMYWIISIENYYQMTADLEFLRMVYPRMESLMDYLMKQRDEQGFIYGRKGDWVFIDWADIDKQGTTCAEQMLLARCYQAMVAVRKLLELDTTAYDNLYHELSENIHDYFWDPELGAFLDSFTSGRRKVSRHPNIFAILFNYASQEEMTSILNNVLLNDQISAITTPYFKFYELEALAMLGRYDMITEAIGSYWGGMLDRGATTFWEEYKPEEPEEAQYGMYGDKYGKSLCHAWGASPIYLIGRYIMGLRPTKPAYETFEIAPQLALYEEFDCELPVSDKSIRLNYRNSTLTVYTNKEGGVLLLGDRKYPLEQGKEESFNAANRPE